MKFWEAMKAMQEGSKVKKKEWEEGDCIGFSGYSFSRCQLSGDKVGFTSKPYVEFNTDDFLYEEWECLRPSLPIGDSSSSIQYEDFMNDKDRFDFLLDRTISVRFDLNKLKEELKS